MDIRRENIAQQKRRKRIIYGVLGVIAIAGITMGLSKLKPAAPGVERSTVWIDGVKHGPMLRQVRGLGTLVPEEIRWLPALTDGRVEKILIRPGVKVKADQVIVELSNPQIQQEAMDADLKLRAAEADFNKTKVQLESDYLNQKAETAKAAQEASQAKLAAETDEQLAKLGVISPNALKVSSGTSEQLQIRHQIEQERLENSTKLLQAQLAAQQAAVEQARALVQLNHTRLESLKVRAGTDGVLQELSLNGNALQEGQQVQAGTTIAKVANPNRLKAELKIPETQAKDVQYGQPAEVDTHNGIISGVVSRIDPSVQNGTRTVDVTLKGALPPGAVPDLSVDGTIDLERIADVLYVGRPAFGQEKSTVSMFKLEGDGKTADRVQVQLGRSSVNTVEIIGGLREGDQVILSDMSRYDNFDRIRLE